MLTAIILVKNEEKNIITVLHRLSWIDELIVVDNGSTDNTATNARENGAVVLSIFEMDFSTMRNQSAKKAKGDWLLYIDTDEEITSDLKQEILHIIESEPSETDPKAYTLKRKNYYMNHEWPFVDGMIRLIYKPALEGWFGKIHETAKIQGNVGTLTNYLIHHTHNTLEDMLTQTNDWSEIEADLRLASHHPPIVSWRLFRVFFTGFFTSYITQKGWQVGTLGFIESMYQGFSMFITYAKLWEKQHGNITR